MGACNAHSCAGSDMPRQHALDSLEKSLDRNSHPVIVLFGDEPFLKQQVLHYLYEAYEREAGFPATQFDGTMAEWRDVSDEVASLSLFASDVRRLAVVDDADKFVTNYRDRLEKLLEVLVS